MDDCAFVSLQAVGESAGRVNVCEKRQRTLLLLLIKTETIWFRGLPPRIVALYAAFFVTTLSLSLLYVAFFNITMALEAKIMLDGLTKFNKVIISKLSAVGDSLLPFESKNLVQVMRRNSRKRGQEKINR
ncbi:hypothetical protein EVAR_37178_1 [Eumeta japonica]|uniref:Uncharacterized protein n=1 Tax=Eumeta variegata TaxID=151549 RepID=A0A4C1WJJ8_EUMVA|nr:hypothetical protein EVAR_37178_1 [Eumeta japonica]